MKKIFKKFILIFLLGFVANVLGFVIGYIIALKGGAKVLMIENIIISGIYSGVAAVIVFAIWSKIKNK